MDINEDLPVEAADDIVGGTLAPEEVNEANRMRRNATGNASASAAAATSGAVGTAKNPSGNMPDPQPH